MDRRLNLALLILLGSEAASVSGHSGISHSVFRSHHDRGDRRYTHSDAELNKVQSITDELEVEWRHLVLEQNALAEHSRVSDIARIKMAMARPKPLEEKVISLP